LESIIEYQNFGWNPATIGFIATIFLTLLQGWSLLKQKQTIQERLSGEPLYPGLFIYSASYSGMLIVYGILEIRAAVIFHGLLMFPYLLVVFYLYYFSELSKSDRLASILFPLLVPIMAISTQPFRDWFFLFGAILVVLPIIGQVRKLWAAGESGSINPRFIIALMISNFFWAMYGIFTDNLPMSILNPISFLILLLFLAFYYAFNRRARKEVGNELQQIQ
jgi:uncharacterized protein with PQ loop repeat